MNLEPINLFKRRKKLSNIALMHDRIINYLIEGKPLHWGVIHHRPPGVDCIEYIFDSLETNDNFNVLFYTVITPKVKYELCEEKKIGLTAFCENRHRLYCYYHKVLKRRIIGRSPDKNLRYDERTQLEKEMYKLNEVLFKYSKI